MMRRNQQLALFIFGTNRSNSGAYLFERGIIKPSWKRASSTAWRINSRSTRVLPAAAQAKLNSPCASTCRTIETGESQSGFGGVQLSSFSGQVNLGVSENHGERVWRLA